MTGITRILASRLFRVLVSVCLLAYMAHRFGLVTIADSMKTADIRWLTASVFVFMASALLGSVQWGILLGFHGIRPGLYVTVSRYFMGLFFNYILPGFVGGDVVRVYHASKVSGLTTQAFSSTLADRVIGLLVLVMFSLGAFLLMPRGTADSVLPVAALLFFLLAGFIGAFAFKPVGRLADRLFSPVTPATVRVKLAAVYGEMHDLTRSPGTLAVVFATSIAIQLTRIGVHYLCGKAVGIDAGFVYFAMFVPVMEIIASLPVSVGGVGVRETVGVTLFATVGIVQPDVVAYSLLATLAGFVGSIPGGIVFALKK